MRGFVKKHLIDKDYMIRFRKARATSSGISDDAYIKNSKMVREACERFLEDRGIEKSGCHYHIIGSINDNFYYHGEVSCHDMDSQTRETQKNKRRRQWKMDF